MDRLVAKHSFIRAAIVFVLVGASTAAQALMPPQVYQRARVAAPYHVQVAIERMRAPSATPGVCRIRGKIVGIFRDTTAKLRVGMPVNLAVSCIQKGDRIPLGGTLWKQVDALKRARYIEAFLNADMAIALWQSRIVSAPSKQPAIKQ
jgi:hypothetical protein